MKTLQQIFKEVKEERDWYRQLCLTLQKHGKPTYGEKKGREAFMLLKRLAQLEHNKDKL